MDWIVPCKTQPDDLSCGFYCYKDHNAYDLRAIFEPWWAARDGVVITVQTPSRANWGRTGWWVEIRHADGSISRYFHLSRIDVVVGQKVVQGQVCGITGNTGFDAWGNQLAPHLHFAIHYPTYAMAIAVWPDPRFALGMWAVDPIYVIQHQEDDVIIIIVGRPSSRCATLDASGKRYIPNLEQLLAYMEAGAVTKDITDPAYDAIPFKP